MLRGTCLLAFALLFGTQAWASVSLPMRDYQVTYDKMVPLKDEVYEIVNPKVYYEGRWRGIAAGTAFVDDWRGTSDADGVCRRFGFANAVGYDYDGSDCSAQNEVVIDRYSVFTHLRKPKCSRGRGNDRNTWHYGNIVCGKRSG